MHQPSGIRRLQAESHGSSMNDRSFTAFVAGRRSSRAFGGSSLFVNQNGS